MKNKKEEILTEESIKKLLEIKGEARGVAFKSDWNFILKKEGEKGLKKLEKKMAESGCPIKYEKIKPTGFYPIGCAAISLQATKELFGYREKEMEEMGAFQFKFSIFLKVIMRYFSNLSFLFKEMPRMWKKYYTVGSLNVKKLDEKEKSVILALKDFKIDPNYCIILGGVFKEGLKMMTASDSISCLETKCVFRGDEFCEFSLKW